MTGQEQGHDLVAELPVGHAAALVVLSMQQDREEITSVGWLGLRAPDDEAGG